MVIRRGNGGTFLLYVPANGLLINNLIEIFTKLNMASTSYLSGKLEFWFPAIKLKKY
jgi:hypothetical protein